MAVVQRAKGSGRGGVDGVAFGPQACACAGEGVLGEGVGDVEAEGDQFLQRGFGAVRVAGGQPGPGGEAVLDDGEGEALLAGVVEVDGAAGPAGSGAYVVDAGACVTLFREEEGGRLQE
ncbi:hypothetical protein MTP02_47950 [Streptomyces albus]|nr:hypothetical protein MTP02_47950 [Streptomyces albus]